MNIETASLKELMAEIERLVKADDTLIEGFNYTYNLSVKDVDSGDYGIMLKNGEIRVQNELYDDADCTLAMKEKLFKKLLAGDLNTAAAFMTGKLKVKGNMGLALKLEGVLKKLNFD